MAMANPNPIDEKKRYTYIHPRVNATKTVLFENMHENK